MTKKHKVHEKGFLKELLKSKKTVFSFKDLLLIWENIDAKTARSRIHYYLKRGDLYHIRRGFYAKDKNYDRFEFATKIYTPSYISFESVLVNAGVIFQHYRQIFVASYQSKELICDKQKYLFKKLKTSILINGLGIENKENYSIASPERAFLDILYLNKDYYFDNMSSLNWEKIYKILPIYGINKRMKKVVNANYKTFKEKFGK